MQGSPSPALSPLPREGCGDLSPPPPSCRVTGHSLPAMETSAVFYPHISFRQKLFWVTALLMLPG